MKIVIIDDEKNARDSVRLMLERISSELEVIGEAESVSESLLVLNDLKPDTILLDIELLDGTGFDILEGLPKFDSNVIFTTAHDEYAIRAIKNNSIDYLLKPIDLEELKIAINKCRNTPHDTESILSNLEVLKTNLYGVKLSISSANTVDFVNSKEILYCQSDGSYSTVYLEDGRTIMCTKSLKYFESLLCNENFFRINKSEYVNIDMVTKYRKDVKNGELTLNGEQTLLISRRKKAEFNLFIKNL